MTRFLVLLIGNSLIDDSWVDCYIFARSVILQEVASIVTARLEGPLIIFSLKDSNPDYSRAHTTIVVKALNLSPKIRFSDFHVSRHYVSLKILFSAKSSAL
jgi:hypothetical protein